jgi:hypothetical protein
MPITLKRYILKDKEGKDLLDTDFTYPLKVSKEIWKVVLTDLTSPRSVIPSPYTSQLFLEGKNTLVVSKEHDSKLVSLETAGIEFVSWQILK